MKQLCFCQKPARVVLRSTYSTHSFSTQRLDLYRPGLFPCDTESEYSSISHPAGKDRSILHQEKRVGVAGGHSAHAHAAQRFAAGQDQLIELITDAKSTIFPFPAHVHRAVFHHKGAVVLGRRHAAVARISNEYGGHCRRFPEVIRVGNDTSKKHSLK